MRKHFCSYAAALAVAGAFAFVTLSHADLPQIARDRVTKNMDKSPNPISSVNVVCANSVGPCCQPCASFEDFEGADFVAGAWISGQGATNGVLETWAASCSQASGSNTEGHVDTINPFGGSLKHVRLSKDPIAPTTPFGCVVDARFPSNAFSNNNTPPLAPNTLDQEVAITAAGGADFNVQPQNRALGFSSARVLFFYTGDIYVLDVVPGFGLTFALVGPWDITGGYQHLKIAMDPCVEFHCNGGTTDGLPCVCDAECPGDPAAVPPIPAGTCNGKIHYEYGSGAGMLSYDGIIYGGLVIDQVLYYSDNFGQHMDVDNVGVIRSSAACPSTCGDGFIQGSEECEFPVVGGGVCAQGDDAACPGKCIAVGAVGECTCLIQNNDPCDAYPLENDVEFVKTAHGGWFTFTAGAPAYAVDTCGVASYDSLLAVWTGTCDSLVLIQANDDCYSGGGSFGANSDPLASCYDQPGAATPPYNSCTCVGGLTIGQQYWVLDARLNANPVGNTVDILLSKRFDCGELFGTRGACCRACTGVCEDNVEQAACNLPGDTFTLNKACGSAEAGTCTASRGACCDTVKGICTECQSQSQCAASPDVLGGPRTWTVGRACADAGCSPALGACCVFSDTELKGKDCTDDVERNDCLAGGGSWTRDQTCEEVNCQNAIPTVSEWGLVVMTLLFLAGAKVYFGRRQAVA